MSGGTLLLALYLPDADPATVDPDALADEVASAATNYGSMSAVEVSAIPGPQWVTPEVLRRLKAASDIAAAAEEYRSAFLAIDGAQDIQAAEWTAMQQRFTAADERLTLLLDALA